ncbi:hypothetical protein BGZ74_011560 [Mortierella antarctica]|nr:hypothetical protein BGZ74_011560 [Mortierella antarctica]
MKNLLSVSLALSAAVLLATTTSALPVESQGRNQIVFNSPEHLCQQREVSFSPDLKGHVLIRFNAKKFANIDLGLSEKDKQLYFDVDEEPIDILLSQLDVWSQNKDKTDVLAHLTKDQYDMFTQAMTTSTPRDINEWQVVDHDLQGTVAKEADTLNYYASLDSLNCAKSNLNKVNKKNKKRPTRVDFTTWFNNYHPHDDIKSFYLQLAEDYKDLVTYIPSIGKTVEGRDIFAVKITAREEDGSLREKPQIWWQGLQHAREWAGGSTVQYLTHHLLSNYGKKDKITSFLQDVEFIIVPIMNIDGYDHTWTNNRLWRKNRRQLNLGAYGVDLNRNWNDHFGQGGSSNFPWSETYRGPSAASEPEVQALSKFFSEHKRIVGAIDFHCYSQLVLRPEGWTTTEAKHEKEHKIVGDKIVELIEGVHGKKYISEPSVALYKTTGAASDWFYGDEATKANNGQPIYSYTIELRPSDTFSGRNGFILPPEEIIPLGEEIAEAMEFFVDYVVKHPLEPK